MDEKRPFTKEEIIDNFNQALENHEFIVYYQPQYNHETKTIIGAEALVRWERPNYGVIPAYQFIEELEANDLINILDAFVFDEVCKFIRKQIDNDMPIVPISTNLSKNDILKPGFIDELEKIRNQYIIPIKYLRFEITESAIIHNNKVISSFIAKLKKLGYICEMDDFGAGYSSLNVLKDISFDVIKLDMHFLDAGLEGRGGTIVESIIRMAHLLEVPIIAEGVEEIEQADFMKSIGCNLIQGWLYSKAINEADFAKLLMDGSITAHVIDTPFTSFSTVSKFFTQNSAETIIFNEFCGPACIFSYTTNGIFEILRVNTKYLQEIGMNQKESEIIKEINLSYFDDANKKILFDGIKKATETEDEVELETWRTYENSCCGQEKICIRSNIKLIGKGETGRVFIAVIKNITDEKKKYMSMVNAENIFKAASEQANIYYWEYNIKTKEMHPCFRCMRDLGLPAVVYNYPEPAIEKGIIPEDYANMYRKWHELLASGVKELEQEIPLTVGRVPFIVRYTTVFDDLGKPIKAYGSATQVVNKK